MPRTALAAVVEPGTQTFHIFKLDTGLASRETSNSPQLVITTG
jgi:hypothetical protein